MNRTSLIQLWRFILLGIAMVMPIVFFISCTSDAGMDSGWQMPKSKIYEYEAGPEGKVIEVNDFSSMDGFTIVIPEGALTETTTITITTCVDAPDLPDGLDNKHNPAIELSSGAPFLKEVQIKFPSYETPETTDEMICAFYWDMTLGNWQVVMPEGFEYDLLIVKTQHFSYWQWGEVRLHEVEDEPLASLFDYMFGPNFIDELRPAVLSEFDEVSFSNYCQNQYLIYDYLVQKQNAAKAAVGAALTAISQDCNVCGLTPNDFISIGISERINIELSYHALDILGFGPGDVWGTLQGIGIVGKHPLQKAYESAIKNLSCDYPCIFENSDFSLWGNLYLYYGAETGLLAMQLAEYYHPCN